MTYDFAALETKIASDRTDWLDHLTDYVIGRTGIHRKQIERYRLIGMDPFTADRIATKVGHHPSAIWPSWYSDALDAQRCLWCADPADAVTCSNPECRRQLRNERQRDQLRLRNWWARVDRYQFTVDPEGLLYHSTASTCVDEDMTKSQTTEVA